LNLSAILGKSAEAKERRLVPEVIEQFFVAASPESGLPIKAFDGKPRSESPCCVYRIGKVPKHLLVIGDSQESRFGRLGREYARIAFDKTLLTSDPTLEWVTPGHPLFESVRADVLTRVDDHLRRGAVFYDLHRTEPAVLDVFAASIRDGRGNTLHRRLFVIATETGGAMSLHEPTIFHDITPAPIGASGADRPIPARPEVEQFLYTQSLQPWISQAAAERELEIARIARHVEISLNALIDRQNVQMANLVNRQIEGQTVPGLDGLIAQAEEHLDVLNARRETRQRELDLERHCAVSDITHIGRAWVLPHPERANPQLAPMVRDEEIERIAIAVAIKNEEERGWVVEDVQTQNRGFDLISRRPHPEDPKTFVEVRFIEVKGRAAVGAVAVSENEYRAAERLKTDYWLYAVFNCATKPELHIVQNPIRLGWQAIMAVEHYRLGPDAITSNGT
jgi:hypothetical protein